MKVSLKWLAEYVDVPDGLQAFCDRLDLTGTGVEGADPVGQQYEGIVVGRIAKREAHPDSDHLWVCSVDVGCANVNDAGEPEPLQIVCGAQNFKEEDRVPVALVGAHLPGDVVIKKSKLRGVASYGMNCSARELGLGEDHSGLMILPPDAPVGKPLAEYLGTSDVVLDLEITPNRPDCLSMEGMAREVGAMYRIPVRDALAGVELAESGEDVHDLADVAIEDAELCPRYTVRVIRDVKIGPSPAWLAERVQAAGARSINNVVDVTNYVMFLLGQPLHAFDYDTLDKHDGKVQVVVRAARDGEEFTTLDGKDRVLTSDMAVIATPERAIALAGVMGGLDSEVTDKTCTILLETATFSPSHTSRTSRNLGLFSEAALRYERTVDDGRIARNADFAAALLAQVSGGTVCRGMVDAWPKKTEPHKLTLRMGRCRAMLGADIEKDEMADILTRLGCDVSDGEEGALDVLAPTFRPDLEREIDLYEEILRLYGMEKVAPTLPGGRGRIGRRTWAEHVVEKLHATLRSCGMNETMTYAFAHPDDLARLRMAGCVDGEAVELINPMNVEQSVMRQSIIPGLLRSVAYNRNHGVQNIQLYEFGNVFTTNEGWKKPKERMKLAGVLAGAMGDAAWNAQPAAFDFFDGKGVLESIARELALPKVRFRALSAGDAPYLQPGRAASVMVDGAEVGWVGELHPLAVAAFETEAPVVAFELDVEILQKKAREARDYVDVPEYPAVQIDVAFVVDEDVSCERMEQCMKSAGGKMLASMRLFDVYRDEARVGAGKKSVAYSLEYRADGRTLTSEEAERAHEKLVSKVCKATGASIRS